MRKIIFLVVSAAVLVASCNKMSFDEESQQALEQEQAEKTLGFKIAEDQDWNMESVVNVTVKLYPEGMKPVALTIYDANPMADTTATIIAETDQVNSPFVFESPSYLQTLYAGCTDKDGHTRVVSFKATDAYVDFTTPAYTAVSQPAAARRAPARIPSYGDLDWQASYNARDLAADGWTDQIAVIAGGSEARMYSDRKDIFDTYKSVFSDGNDADRYLHFDENVRTYYYMKVGQGGSEITVTPIGTNGSISTLQFGYYYFEKGQAHEVKKVRKYLFEDHYDYLSKDKSFTEAVKSFKLVYFDAEGNASYTFPEGTEVSFFCRTTIDKHDMEWYAEGENNIDRSLQLQREGIADGIGSHDWWKEANHVLFFQRNGYKFVGIEDWYNNFNMKDLVMLVDGNVEDFPANDNLQKIGRHIYTFAFEDTKNGDFDLNDVVMQVYRGSGYWGTSRQNGIHVRLVALGAEDPIKAYFRDVETGEVTELFGGRELHEAFDLEDMSFVNTQSINFDFSKENKNNYSSTPRHTFVSTSDGSNRIIWRNVTQQDIYIVNERTGQEIHTPRAQGLTGSAPYGICVPYKWAWPKERVRITAAYPNFAQYASSVKGGVIDVTDWYVNSVDGKTLIYDFGFNFN